MKIIALSGWKRSGKDTVAEMLANEYGFYRYSFAAALKDLTAQQYVLPREWCDDPEYKEKPLLNMPVETKDDFGKMIHQFMRLEFRDQNGARYGSGSPESIMYWTPRALCILEGSVKRSAKSNYWVKRVIDQINLYTTGGHVITDLRYKSEVSQLKEAFGDDLITVRVDRFDSSPSTDPSERDLDNYDFDLTINNRGTLEQLTTQVNQLIDTLKNDNKT